MLSCNYCSIMILAASSRKEQRKKNLQNVLGTSYLNSEFLRHPVQNWSNFFPKLLSLQVLLKTASWNIFFAEKLFCRDRRDSGNASETSSVAYRLMNVGCRCRARSRCATAAVRNRFGCVGDVKKVEFSVEITCRKNQAGTSLPWRQTSKFLFTCSALY